MMDKQTLDVEKKTLDVVLFIEAASSCLKKDKYALPGFLLKIAFYFHGFLFGCVTIITSFVGIIFSFSSTWKIS